MRILYVGESWLGSSARSLKEALRRIHGIVLDEINEDLIVPNHDIRGLRAVDRLLYQVHRRELEHVLAAKVTAFSPDVVLAYKGAHLSEATVAGVKAAGPFVVNVFPDCSPLTHGRSLREALGSYDLIISTKPFHPTLWGTEYGYRNPCIHVPHGYDPLLHLVVDEPPTPVFDLVLIATWRSEYGELMRSLARDLGDNVQAVVVAGAGWRPRAAEFPHHWILPGGVTGQSYVDLLRRGRICIAPLTRQIRFAGRAQPGDEDTTRTYELAAAGCFFVHRRTPYLKGIYDEAKEVPMYDTPAELAAQIMRYLPRAAERSAMAAAVQMRAVPAYCVDGRAREIVTVLEGALRRRSR